jgi:MoxR-like ATPase
VNPATHTHLKNAIDSACAVLRGNRQAVEMVMAAVLAKGHVLLEDVPGVGKTMLARAMARVLDCSFSRIQFTADMLPSDVIGVQVLDAHEGTFRFKKGPLFAQIVLADEINRASPKTQSAMLEAMSDQQVTVDDETFHLGDPFVVLATQNPLEHHGAYPLPENQLDRFMVRLSLGYPPRPDELELIAAPFEPERVLSILKPQIDAAELRMAQKEVESVHLSDAVADYLLLLVEMTRRHAEILLGCSPRGAIVLALMARAWAYVRGRDFVLPDDIKLLAPPVVAHRLMLAGAGPAGGARHDAEALVRELLTQVPAPR